MKIRSAELEHAIEVLRREGYLEPYILNVPGNIPPQTHKYLVEALQKAMPGRVCILVEWPPGYQVPGSTQPSPLDQWETRVTALHEPIPPGWEPIGVYASSEYDRDLERYEDVPYRVLRRKRTLDEAIRSRDSGG